MSRRCHRIGAPHPATTAASGFRRCRYLRRARVHGGGGGEGAVDGPVVSIAATAGAAAIGRPSVDQPASAIDHDLARAARAPDKHS